MRKTGAATALACVLLAICAAVAYEWYAHVRQGVTRPVQQIAASNPSASPSPAPAPTPTPTPTPGPVVYVPQPEASPNAEASAPASPAAASSAPQAQPTPYSPSSGAVAHEPMVAATLGPRALAVSPLREPPDAPPRILAMSLSTPVARGGQVVSGTVETTSNVASVEARIGGYSSSMRKVGVGRFALSYRVPYLPFFFHRTYSIEVIARNTRGDAVSTFVPITIR